MIKKIFKISFIVLFLCVSIYIALVGSIHMRAIALSNSHFIVENVNIDIPSEFMSSIPNVEVRYFGELFSIRIMEMFAHQGRYDPFENFLTFRVIEGFEEENMHVYYDKIIDSLVGLLVELGGFPESLMDVSCYDIEEMLIHSSHRVIFHSYDYDLEKLVLFSRLVKFHGFSRAFSFFCRIIYVLMK